uniref:Uncharacterized protein n=1 Tax=Paramoeba aestuarina TaxID=180227 RepID=A0A7S4L448_9EUKA|mmetsp:Transcript_31131/g.48550  ORF Transcript_31131/g.48550 Transcript_31131/m.48550 type:complete len:191 (+) Transcript_31131:1062-1634(+)
MMYLNEKPAMCEDKINFAKFQALTKSVCILLQPSLIPPPETKKTSTEIRGFILKHSPVLSVDDLFEWSKKVEPRNMAAVLGEILTRELSLKHEITQRANMVEKLEKEKDEVAQQLKKLEERMNELQKKGDEGSEEREEKKQRERKRGEGKEKEEEVKRREEEVKRTEEEVERREEKETQKKEIMRREKEN